MRAYTFNTPSPACPVCHPVRSHRSHKTITGLLTCQYCRERLVVSWSGHYVRDPFISRHRQAESLLRRKSHPIARIWRNLNQPCSLLLFAALGSAICIGVASLLLPNASELTPESKPVNKENVQRR
jgi:hypothetical protein